MDTQHTHTNRLIEESSPYLRQHAHNPVDWYPWGEEALTRARQEDKPIFLSIGYAACHWCHVMERESFENAQIADVLNTYFVSIKVDREQRPDLDQIYMSFTTALTGSGGWPMSVFLTPELKPFFAGTYFPPDDRYGRPGFMKVVTEIGRAYDEEKEQIVESANDIFEKVTERIRAEAQEVLLSPEMIRMSLGQLYSGVDDVYGGFGEAPKFPHATEIAMFLRYYKKSGDLRYLQAAERALKGMARGGLYDQLGGGFARYSTDRQWLVPHFEKMLYDNALLVPVYADAFKITGEQMYLRIVRETLDFILREMTDHTGGFYSALDADSEGEEGKFYVWTKEEIDTLLGEDAPQFERYYNVSAKGNFEGKNILHLTGESDRMWSSGEEEQLESMLNRCRRKLLDQRDKRVRPLTDDKMLTSWNGLALSAFARGFHVTGDRRYLEAAVDNARFVREELYRNGRLGHSYREGRHSDGEFLEDYAYYISGLLDLYTTYTGKDNAAWLEFAVELAERSIGLFFDAEGTAYLTPPEQSDLIVRPKDETDGAMPSAGSYMLLNLMKLHRLTGNQRMLDVAEKGLKKISGLITRYPTGMTSALTSLDFYLSDKVEVVVIGSDEVSSNMLDLLCRWYYPNSLIAHSTDGRERWPLFAGRELSDGRTQAYVCVNSSCHLPVSTTEELKEMLSQLT